MKLKFSAVLVLWAVLFNAPAHAADAALQIHGDLMVHPDQVTDLFVLAGNQIRSSSVWDWPALQFTKPYKTSWSNVQAHGPFDMQFDTTNLKTQELGFTLTWANPTISVGTFEIHDTVSTTVGGIPVTVHLDGACSGLQANVPSGQWVVKGKMHWDFSTQSFAVTWEAFSLGINTAAVIQLSLGQCQGQPNLIQSLHDAMIGVLSDQATLQDIFKQGIADWMQTTLGSLQTQLLQERDVKIKDNIAVKWIPSDLSTLPGGLLRVAGTFNLSKPGSTVGADQLPRNYDPAILNAVTESGFVLPKDTMQRMLNYLYSNGELQYRVNSSSIASFTSLMNNTFLQFFIWPDLLAFASTTQFYFDLGTGASPKLSGGYMLNAGGSAYNVALPMTALQWAPTDAGKYLPYINFSTPVTGQLQAQIAKGMLTMQLTTSGDLNLQSVFRSEYAATRDVNSWMATSVLGSSVQDFLNATPFSIAVPTWQLGTQLSLGMRDLQVWKQTFRVPLQFTATP